MSFGAPRKDVGERKRPSATKKFDKSLEREKDRRKDEEKESLLSRIGRYFRFVLRGLGLRSFSGVRREAVQGYPIFVSEQQSVHAGEF